MTWPGLPSLGSPLPCAQCPRSLWGGPRPPPRTPAFPQFPFTSGVSAARSFINAKVSSRPAPGSEPIEPHTQWTRACGNPPSAVWRGDQCWPIRRLRRPPERPGCPEAVPTSPRVATLPSEQRMVGPVYFSSNLQVESFQHAFSREICKLIIASYIIQEKLILCHR